MKPSSTWVGCSGWYYWHWKGVVYPAELEKDQWFDHYQKHFKTVELNAPFYHWPRPSTVEGWARRARRGFKYSVKVNQTITHLKRFKGTRKLIAEFYKIADTLGDKMGCFLFQLPPSFKFSKANMEAVLDQLDPAHRNVVEFRHPSWWTEDVFDAFKRAGAIFCSVSAPRLPAEVVKTSNAVYVRFHGSARWYAYDYAPTELEAWARKIADAGAAEVWAYFNNDRDGCAFRNALALARYLQKCRRRSAQQQHEAG
ncbi:MAG: DUF72 domain-containing protein [Verrucomicrobiae bacterium]|nr:DUF72 domain-containing protein [Verrucomicrobiae bacterium]MCX7721520.1 DUF72 domain-containing protein [Verrucomicrobiae bacterium]MDW7979238.1 DUF72 domain-containing protein [Verrucomicrobiales bacterium]